MLLAAINQTLAATALPMIVGELGGLAQYSWVFSAYVLGATLTIPLYGKLSDIYGRRALFTAAILLFSAGSITAGLAPSMDVLVAGRAIQGIGAGGLLPLGMAVIGDIIAPRARGRWQAVTGSVFAVSAVGGPTLGGWIADNASWRLIFFVSLPLAALARGPAAHLWRRRGARRGLLWRRRLRVELAGHSGAARQRRPGDRRLHRLGTARRGSFRSAPAAAPPCRSKRRHRPLRPRRCSVRRRDLRAALRPGCAGRERHERRRRADAADALLDRRGNRRRPDRQPYGPRQARAARRAASPRRRLRAPRDDGDRRDDRRRDPQRRRPRHGRRPDDAWPRRRRISRAGSARASA